MAAHAGMRSHPSLQAILRRKPAVQKSAGYPQLRDILRIFYGLGYVLHRRRWSKKTPESPSGSAIQSPAASSFPFFPAAIRFA